MTILLHLDASANRSSESITRALSARFATAWLAADPTSEHRYRDLYLDPVPALTTEFCLLGRRVEQHRPTGRDGIDALTASDAERDDWRITRALIDDVIDADTILLGCPMYNFSVPAALKGWIDRITFPGVYRHPLDGTDVLARTNVVVVAACGGGYGPGAPNAELDFHVPYLRAYFGKIGIPADQLHVIRAELTLAELAPQLAHLRSIAAASMETAIEDVDRLAADLTRWPALAP
jgi:FMN-dependent NADH-azoreductase